MYRFVGAAVVLVGLLAGCSGGEPEGLLRESDLPPVVNSSDTRGSNGRVGACGALDGPEFSVGIATEPEPIGRNFKLEGGDVVTSTLLGVPHGYGTVDAALERVRDAIRECVGREDAEQFEEIGGLEGGPSGTARSRTPRTAA